MSAEIDTVGSSVPAYSTLTYMYYSNPSTEFVKHGVSIGLIRIIHCCVIVTIPMGFHIAIHLGKETTTLYDHTRSMSSL